MHVVVSVSALECQLSEIFRRAGFSPTHADAVARNLAAAERDGCKSHGIYRVEGCLRTLKAGKLSPNAVPKLTTDASAVVRVEAGGSPSSLAFEVGAPVLAELAKELGVAALVINDCVHFTALWPEVEALTDRDLAGLAMCPSYATVAPAGGIAPLLGTNPIAFGWPRPGQTPYIFDFATSVAARGEIELHRRAGRSIPEGWAIDATGQPTTDPQLALQGAMLTFGSHKGSAIATMVELLAGVMIGDLTSSGALEALGTTSLNPRHGELVLAFCPEHFGRGRAQDLFARAEILFKAIEDQGARLPSSRRYKAREVSAVSGIHLTKAEDEMLQKFRREGLDALDIQ